MSEGDLSGDEVTVTQWIEKLACDLNHRKAKFALLYNMGIILSTHRRPAGLKKSMSKVKDAGVVRDVGKINHGKFNTPLELHGHASPSISPSMNPCEAHEDAHPRAYIGEAVGANRPYSVAWISQRLAEPRTRVRIAVGPPIHLLQAKARWRIILSNCRMRLASSGWTYSS